MDNEARIRYARCATITMGAERDLGWHPSAMWRRGLVRLLASFREVTMEGDTGCGRNAGYHAILHYAMVYMFLYTMYMIRLCY